MIKVYQLPLEEMNFEPAIQRWQVTKSTLGGHGSVFFCTKAISRENKDCNNEQ